MHALGKGENDKNQMLKIDEFGERCIGGVLVLFLLKVDSLQTLMKWKKKGTKVQINSIRNEKDNKTEGTAKI